MDKLVIQKDNKLIQSAVNRFDYKQNQLMCLLLGKYVNTKEQECIDTTITVNELRNALNLTDGKKNYDTIRKAINSFAENSSVGIYDEVNQKYIWRPFFDEITLDINKKNITFSWNQKMKPHLINLKSKFTQYLANDYLKLKSVYSQNLYEQMKSYENWENTYKQKKIITVDELRKVMQVNGKKTYNEFKKFNELCLKRAIKDINKHTDIFVQMETVKKGRTVTGCIFTIKSKNEKFDYNGCWLTGNEVNDIISKFGKNKINELGKIKKENKQYYTLLRQGNKSDYDIIINFIEQDRK